MKNCRKASPVWPHIQAMMYAFFFRIEREVFSDIRTLEHLAQSGQIGPFCHRLVDILLKLSKIAFIFRVNASLELCDLH